MAENISVNASYSEAVEAQLRVFWQQHGPVGHPYESLYWEAAQAMVARAHINRMLERRDALQSEVELALSQGRIKIKPDSIRPSTSNEPHKIQRFRTGRRTKSELTEHPIYGLYIALAVALFPEQSVEVEVIYLGTGEIERVSLTSTMMQSRLDKYNDAMRNIQAGNFPALVDEDECPYCPFYFICDG